MKCPKRIHLIETKSDVKDTPDDPKEKETEEVEEIVPMEGLESLMFLKEATSTIQMLMLLWIMQSFPLIGTSAAAF